MEETRHSNGEQTVRYVKTMVVYHRRDAHPHWRLCGEDQALSKPLFPSPGQKRFASEGVSQRVGSDHV